jgi:hypothetical protein
MKRAPLLALLVLVAGCQSAREAAGMYQRAADKGIEVSVGDSAPAQEAARRPDGGPLPGGLVGDTANRAYTSDTPKPQ